jgi:hypothetical protein
VSLAAGSPSIPRPTKEDLEVSAVSAVSPISMRRPFPATCGGGLLARAAAKSNIRLAVGYPDRFNRYALRARKR